MILAEDLWLRGKAAQSSFMQLLAYNTAFAGTAAIQTLKMSLTAPTGFWQAMARASASNASAAPVVSAPKPRAPAKKAARAPVAKAVATPKAAAPAPEPEALGQSPHLLDAPRGGKADDLTVLTGVGAKLAKSLNEFGIYHFDQLATLDADGIDWLNEQQSGFKMICARFGIVDQARARLA
jgi:predicted flap endonuclease-1-like 5' DNA nuclease